MPWDRFGLGAVAPSPTSFDDAVRQGITRASETLKGINGAWVSEREVPVKAGEIDKYRVVMRGKSDLDD